MNLSDKQSIIIKTIGESLHKKDIVMLKKGLVAYSAFARESAEAARKSANYQVASDWMSTAARFDAIVLLINQEGLSDKVRNAIATKGKSLDAPKVSPPAVKSVAPQPNYAPTQSTQPSPSVGYAPPMVTVIPDPNWSARMFEKFLPAVATIETETGAGTGFFISNNGYMLTNHHVVHNGNTPNKNIYITTGDKKIKSSAYVVDSDKKSDVALLCLNNSKGKTPFIPMVSNFSTLRPGDGVMIIGNALDFGLAPVTGTIKFPKSQDVDEDLLYSALTNCGDSGSPLINANGVFVGVNKASLFRSGETEVQGIAVATNGDKVKSLLEQWKRKHAIKF